MYLNIILLPLLNFLILSNFGFIFGYIGSCFLSILSLLFTFLISIYIYFEVVINQISISIKLYHWVYLDIYSIQFGFFFDSINSIMLLIITFISFLVHLYSISYLWNDPYITRFMGYLSLFTFFMIILVTSDNILQLFIGWEGVGLCSYLLINFWFTRLLANKAALKAMIINRISDIFFLIIILYIFLLFKTTDLIIVINSIDFILNESIFFFFKNINSLDFISFFLFLAAIGKSAQIGFHIWLPDAMEGPTPVSALLHAATMVTAGIFLIIRCSIIIDLSNSILLQLIFFGSISTFFAGFTAIFQYDIKKIIAYSTISQLGYMLIACGLSNYYLALFHLFNHAFFKALLFLSAGVIIHAFIDEQDMRRFGGNIFLIMPFTYICFLIGSLSIMGFPYTTGFFSKELIIDFSFKRYIIDSIFCYIICLFSAIFTSIYSLKLLFYTFLLRGINSFKFNYKNFIFINNDSDYIMLIPLLLLLFLTIFVGFLFNDIIIGLGSNIWINSIVCLLSNEDLCNYIFLPYFIKDIPFIIISVFIFIILIYTYILNSNFFYNEFFFDIVCFSKLYNDISNIGFNSFFFNNLYNNLFIILYKLFYNINFKCLDKGLFEYFGPFGLYFLNKIILNLFPFFYYKKLYFSSFIKIFFIWNLILVFFIFLFSNFCNNHIGFFPLLFIIIFIKLYKN